jgi:hypothetical protein
MWDLIFSAVGYFVLKCCFRLVEEGGYTPKTKASTGAIGKARDPFAYVCAALILLILATNEQPGLIRAASKTHSRYEAGTNRNT